MARRTWNRTRRRKTRRVRFRYKRRSARRSAKRSGRIWKYVKKATRSEVKRCDFFDVDNISYVGTVGSISYMYSYLKFLSTMVIKNTYVANRNMPSVDVGSVVDGEWCFWHPIRFGFDLTRGPTLNQRVGNEVFMKYLNFKFVGTVGTQYAHNVACSVYLAVIKANTDFSANVVDLSAMIWNNTYKIMGVSYADSQFATSADFAAYNDRVYHSYYMKKRVYAKGVRLIKLFSLSLNAVQNEKNVTKMMYSGVTYSGGGSTLAQATGLVPTTPMAPNITSTLDWTPELRTRNKIKSKLVRINLPLRYDVGGGLMDYQFFLIPVCSTVSSQAYSPMYPNMSVKVQCECVYTDK